MRNCPACHSPKQLDAWYLIPDNLNKLSRNVISLCECGMFYFDTDERQTKCYDAYKKSYDLAFTEHSNPDNLVSYIQKIIPTKFSVIIDFGSKDKRVVEKLVSLGYDAYSFQKSPVLPSNISLLVASNMVKSIYELKGIMLRLSTSAKGKLLVELPNPEPSDTLPPLEWDMKHINHFSIHAMNLLMERYGYFLTNYENYEVNYFPVIRALYERTGVPPAFSVSRRIYLQHQARQFHLREHISDFERVIAL